MGWTNISPFSVPPSIPSFPFSFPFVRLRLLQCKPRIEPAFSLAFRTLLFAFPPLCFFFPFYYPAFSFFGHSLLNVSFFFLFFFFFGPPAPRASPPRTAHPPPPPPPPQITQRRTPPFPAQDFRDDTDQPPRFFPRTPDVSVFPLPIFAPPQPTTPFSPPHSGQESPALQAPHDLVCLALLVEVLFSPPVCLISSPRVSLLDLQFFSNDFTELVIERRSLCGNFSPPVSLCSRSYLFPNTPNAVVQYSLKHLPART